MTDGDKTGTQQSNQCCNPYLTLSPKSIILNMCRGDLSLVLTCLIKTCFFLKVYTQLNDAMHADEELENSKLEYNKGAPWLRHMILERGIILKGWFTQNYTIEHISQSLVVISSPAILPPECHLVATRGTAKW